MGRAVDRQRLLHSWTALNQAVKRNIERFPDDFMFQLTRNEVQAVNASRSQNVILKRGQNVKYLPYAFTEQGIAMLSSVLRSPRAVEVNIAIIAMLTGRNGAAEPRRSVEFGKLN